MIYAMRCVSILHDTTQSINKLINSTAFLHIAISCNSFLTLVRAVALPACSALKWAGNVTAINYRVRSRRGLRSWLFFCF